MTLLVGGAALAIGSPSHAQQQQDDALDDAISQPVVQAIPSQDTMRLNDALNRVARNPRDTEALIDSGNAALALGDTDAAIGFFRRAGQVSPGDGRVKAGLAGAFVRNGDPFSAIPMFDEADRAGGGNGMLVDRGLAWDMVGDNAKAQGFYRRAIAQGTNDEALRRLALSLAIAGDRRGADAALAPLLQRQDKAAWRTRVFALAIGGQTEEAVRLAQTTMPAELASAMVPYLRYMRSLTPAQQAAAANLGQFPRASDIGRDDSRVALYAPPKPVALAVTVPAGNQSGGRNSRNHRRSQDDQVAMADRRRPGSLFPAPVRTPPAEVAPTRTPPAPTTAPAPAAPTVAAVTRPAAPVWPSVPVRPVVAAATPAPSAPPPTVKPVEAAIAAVAPRPMAPPPAATAVPLPPVAVAAVAPTPSVPVATPAADPPRVAVADPAPALAPARVPTVAQASPGFGSLEGVGANPAVSSFDLAHSVPSAAAATPPVPAAVAPPVVPPVAPQVAVASPVSAPPAPATVASQVTMAAPMPAPVPQSSAPPVVPVPSRTQSLAEAFSDLAKPAVEVSPAPGAVDIRRIRPRREVSEEQAAKDAAAKVPPPPSHPSRIWVQMATGRDKGALAFDWRRLLRQAAEPLRNKKGYTSAWGQSNRLLTGPFETEAAANAFVTQLRRADVSGAFVWTSPAGQVVDVLGGK
ncbi:MAG: tetratricopeptide repeat protein [Sphingomonadales bacterium]|nr:tetratricopeptide repeat protein [Sphingomonadales bacterium]